MGDSGDDIVVSTVVTGDGMGGGSCCGVVVTEATEVGWTFTGVWFNV